MKYTNYKSKNSILSGLSELLENRFIARGSNPYKYYLNPTIFFNGDRLTLVKHFEVDEKKSLPDS